MSDPRNYTNPGHTNPGHTGPAARIAVCLVAALASAGPVEPAVAHHLDSVGVTQVGGNGLAATIQVDVTYDGGAGGGIFGWTTGDGGTGAVPDGTASDGTYLGDASGVGTFSGPRPASVAYDLSTFTWSRSHPAPNVARTQLSFAYAGGGLYTLTWTACCPARDGSAPVVVQGPATPAPFLPAGVVEISGTSADGATYEFDGFVPDRGLWACRVSPWTGTATEVTCIPPLAPAGFANVCAAVTLVAESDPSGVTTGSSACATGRPASAWGGPWTGVAADAQPPRAPCPWTCSASVALTAATPWRVRCTVNG